MSTFNIYVRSYNRYNNLMTKNLVDYCTYVVRKSQEKQYRDAGVEDILSIDDYKINSGEKVLNYLIENAKEDVICVLDDDIKLFKYRTDKYEKIADKSIVTEEIERLAQLIYDLDIGYANVAGHTNLMYYDRPFRFYGVNGGVKIFNRAKVKGRFNSKYRFLSDDDFEFQELLYNRVILLCEYFVHDGFVDTNAGGNNDNKTRKEFAENHALLKSKWGKYYKEPKDGGSGSFVVKR